VGGSAGPDHGHGGRIGRGDPAFCVEKKGWVVDLAEGRRIGRIVDRDEGNAVGRDAALFLGQVDVPLPPRDMVRHFLPDAVDRAEFPGGGGENGLRRSEPPEQPPHPDGSHIGKQVQGKVGFNRGKHLVIYY
jgi:hypothetical protein